LSGTDYHNVLVVTFDDRGGRGIVVHSLFHGLIVEVTSDYTSDDGAATISRLRDRVRLVCLSNNVA
jgi:hypothetical protein